MRTAVAAAVLALPAGALAHLGLEVLTAAGRVHEATTVVRIAVPLGVLVFVAAVVATGATLSGAAVIAAREPAQPVGGLAPIR